MQTDENTFVVNSEAEISALGKWVRERFAAHPYQVFTALDGLTRTQEQNSKLWPMLTDISAQVEWFGKKFCKEDWKDIITASFRGAQFVPNLSGTGFVAIGMRTSKMNRKAFGELIESIYAFGAEKGVVWSERSEQVYQEAKSDAGKQ